MGNIIRFIHNLDKTTLSMCGLDPEFNLIESPRCECGCGTKARMMIGDTKDLFGVMANILFGCECLRCGVFAVMNDGTLYWSVKYGEDYEDIDFFSMEAGAQYPENIEEIFNTFELHCYGLLVEVEPGEFEIIDE